MDGLSKLEPQSREKVTTPNTIQFIGRRQLVAKNVQEHFNKLLSNPKEFYRAKQEMSMDLKSYALKNFYISKKQLDNFNNQFNSKQNNYWKSFLNKVENRV